MKENYYPDLEKKLIELKEIFDEFLHQEIVPILEDSFPEVYEPILYLLLNGGKRIRPSLFLLLSGFHSGLSEYEKKEFLFTASSIESIHTYSLIHDDLPAMDNDDMRRGKPSCHIAFPEWAAILAGDSLNTFSFFLLSQTDSDIKKKLEILSQYSGISGMIFGQALDIANEKKNFPYRKDYYTKDFLSNKINKYIYNKDLLSFFNKYLNNIDFLKLFLIHYGKTASLFKAIGMLSAITGKIENSHPIISYSETIGILFQIVDDLLDELGTENKLGKKVKKDTSKGKITFVNYLGEKEALQVAELLSHYAASLSQNFDIPYTNKNYKGYLEILPDYILKREK